MNHHRIGNEQNTSFSQQNILANSIRIARQKINKIQQSQHNNHNHHNQSTDQNDIHNQTFSFSKPKKQTSAAQAIKALHNRISQLEAFNITLTKQTSQSKRQVSIKNLQIQSLKNELSELNKKIIQCKENYSKVQLSLKIKQAAIAQLQRQLKQKDHKNSIIITQKDIRLTQSLKLRQDLEQKVLQLNKRIDNNQKVIVQMIKQLEEEKSKSMNNTGNIINNQHFNSPNTMSNSNAYEKYRNSKSNKSKEYDNFPVIVDQPDGQNPMYKAESLKKNKENREVSLPRKIIKNSSIKKNQKNLQTVNKQLREKNQQLYNMLRASDRKFREEEKAKNTFKDKFYSLKNATDSIIEQINRLPNSYTHKFKCLIVKIKKIQSQNLECLRSYTNFSGNRHHSKSSRHSSKENSGGSKSKEKPLKMEDLNLSDHNMSQTKSRSKSKKRQITSYLKSSSAKKAMRSSIVQQNDQNQMIKVLNKRIRKQRKQLCEMHKRMNQQKDEAKIMLLKVQFEEKMRQNIELISQMQSYKNTQI